MRNNGFTAVEQAVVRKLARGEAVIFDPSAPAAGRTIGGAMLAKALVGDLPDYSGGASRVVIHNCVVEGLLDLTHARRQVRSDAPLLMLEAKGCRFTDAPKLCDARIAGLRLIDCRLPALKGERLHIVGDLSLDDSTLCGHVEFPRCQITGALTAFDGKIFGDLDLNHASIGIIDIAGAVVWGEICLNFGQIDGSVCMDRATIGNGRSALIVSGATIGGRLKMHAKSGQRTVCRGAINGVGASIKVGVELQGAKLDRAAAAYALDLARLDTDGCVFLRHHEDGKFFPFDCNGAIDLSGARIGGYARILNARLTPTKAYLLFPGEAVGQLEANGVCLDLSGASVANFLELANITNAEGDRVDGEYRLAGARVGMLRDQPESSWPRQHVLDLTGFSYDFLPPELEWPQRRAWLMRQYSIGLPESPAAAWLSAGKAIRTELAFCRSMLLGDPHDWAAVYAQRKSELALLRAQFSPQPFEQLAAVLRKMGYSAEADEIAICKRRMRVLCRAESFWHRFFSRFMHLTSRHGYSPMRSLLWMIAYWMLGATLLALGLAEGWADLEHKTSTAVEYVRYGVWYGGAFNLAPPQPTTCPDAIIPLYTLEILIPGLELGETDGCELGGKTLGDAIIGAVRTAYQVLGAILVAVMVTTFTGILRRD